jgi:alpha-tubulin suppressor-like RCC1 family protein
MNFKIALIIFIPSIAVGDYKVSFDNKIDIPEISENVLVADTVFSGLAAGDSFGIALKGDGSIVSWGEILGGM